MPYSVNPTHRLLTHVAPVDKNAVKELRISSPVPWSMSECPPLCPVSPKIIAIRHRSNFRDLTGLRLGSVVVIGLSEWADKGRSRWVVRCDCGNFEFRRHYRWWKKYRDGGGDDACERCHSTLPKAVLDQGRD